MIAILTSPPPICGAVVEEFLGDRPRNIKTRHVGIPRALDQRKQGTERKFYRRRQMRITSLQKNRRNTTKEKTQTEATHDFLLRPNA